MADSKVTPERVKNLLSSFLSGISKLGKKSLSERTNQTQQTDAKQKASTGPLLSKDAEISVKEKPDARDRTQFYNRVETYSPMTWFAKPLDLSPLVCARYGWENTETDMLQCVACRACLCGQLPRAVDTLGYRESYKKLKTNLVASHEKLCTWSTNPSPESFMSVPYHNKEELSKDVRNCLETLVNCQSSLPTVAYSSYEKQGITEDRLKEMSESLQPRLEDDIEAGLSHNTCLLALLGWNFSSEQVDILHCNYCRRRVGLWNYKHTASANGTDTDHSSREMDQHGTERGQNEEESGEPCRKRAKIEKQSFDPVAEHRYWCPWLQTETTCFKSNTSQMDNTQSTSPDSSPLKSTPAKDSVQLHSTPTRDSAKETELPKEPAWLIVLKLLSGKEVYDGSSNSFQTKMKWSPQLEGVRHLRQVLRECTSPTASSR